MRINFGEDEGVEVQMAPLIDCVFLLLIFFLVASTLKKIEPELPLEPPLSTRAHASPVIEDMTVVSIDTQGNLYLGAEPVGQGYLMKHLEQVAGEDRHRRVRIDGDGRTPLQAVVQVLDMCDFVGLDNVGLKARTDVPDIPVP